MTRTTLLALAAFLLAPGAAWAQTGASVTQNPPVPARPPVTGNAGPIASDATQAPPERIAPPATGTPGPGLAGAPPTGVPAAQPARPHG